MRTYYGFPLDKWKQAGEEMRQILIETAKSEGVIAYSDLVARVSSIRIEPDFYALAQMLGEISTEEDAAGRGLLSVVVVHKSGDMQPGPGFFDLAKRRGRNVTDIASCWIQELKRVYASWSRGQVHRA